MDSNVKYYPEFENDHKIDVFLVLTKIQPNVLKKGEKLFLRQRDGIQYMEKVQTLATFSIP